MTRAITKKQVMKLVGKNIVAVRKDGTKVMGKLVRISGDRLYVQPASSKKVQTKAIIPLVLYNLLAVGTSPYAYGGYGYSGAPYGGGYGYGGGGYTGGAYGYGYNPGYGGTPYPYGYF